MAGMVKPTWMWTNCASCQVFYERAIETGAAKNIDCRWAFVVQTERVFMANLHHLGATVTPQKIQSAFEPLITVEQLNSEAFQKNLQAAVVSLVQDALSAAVQAGYGPASPAADPPQEHASEIVDVVYLAKVIMGHMQIKPEEDSEFVTADPDLSSSPASLLANSALGVSKLIRAAASSPTGQYVFDSVAGGAAALPSLLSGLSRTFSRNPRPPAPSPEPVLPPAFQYLNSEHPNVSRDP